MHVQVWIFLTLLPLVRGFQYAFIGSPAESYGLPELPYPTDGLEPWIAAATVDVHYNGHHRAYTTNMNSVLKKWRQERPEDELHKESIVHILERITDVPSEYRMAIRNHGGGFVNHVFYWHVMSPPPPETSGSGSARMREPHGALRAHINQQFGGFDQFREAFTEKAKALFGSGYVWLALPEVGGALEIFSTANQDCPLSMGYRPLLVIDVWEHAYYLDHKNKRASYIDNWWHVVNWNKVEELDSFWKNGDQAKDEL